MYNFDLIYIIYMLLPPSLRNPKLVYFIASLLTPVQTLYEDFIKRRNELYYYLSSTGQVIYLERLLAYEFGGHDIKITDGLPDSGSYIGHYPLSNMIIAHYSNESADIYHYSATVMDDFIVQVPAMLYDDMKKTDFDRMKAIVEKYKLINKTYKIVKV